MNKKKQKAGLGSKKIIRDTNKKEIVMGVLLSDEADWREHLTADASLDRVIDSSANSDDMLEDLRDLQKRGTRIKKLVLVGHGSFSPTIGVLQPEALDKNAIRAKRALTYKDIWMLKARLALFPASSNEKKEIQKKLKGNEDYYQQLTHREHLLDEIRDVMARDAEIEVQACREAKYGMPLMARVAHTLLRKNGGTLRGNMEDVTLETNNLRKVMGSLFGAQYKYKSRAKGDWITLRCPAVPHASGGTCGEPCRNFERYGFCDHRVGSDGGSCWAH
jgi:hypothetical protein